NGDKNLGVHVVLGLLEDVNVSIGVGHDRRVDVVVLGVQAFVGLCRSSRLGLGLNGDTS
ncbi:hypothetical protein F442_18139, partial [Phytophthora nicotianae P10297]